MILRELLIKLGYDLDKGSERKVEDSISGIKSMANKFLGAVGVTFSFMGLKDIVETSAELKAVEAQFSQTFRDINTGASYVDEATQKLENLSNEVGISESRMKGSYASIAAFAKTSGMDVEDAMNFAEEAMKLAADSSAYFDRSMEDTTYILKSLLKGNFQMDDNLGFQATQFTRDAKAMELFNKSYNDLSEAEKQKTILKLMADANKQMGAFGQAARESGEYTNQMAELNAKFKEFKAVSGNIFLEPFIKGLQLAKGGMTVLIKAVKLLTGKNSFLNRLTEGYHARIKRLSPAMERLSAKFEMFKTKASNGLSKVAKLFGGMDNLIRLSSLIVSAFFAVWAWKYIIGGLKALMSVLRPLFALLGGFSLTSMLIVGAIIAIGLAIEDFVNFLAGNDSLIGKFFDSFGIGADNARDKIFDAFNDLIDLLGSFITNIMEWLDGIQPALETLGNVLVTLWGIFKKVFAPIIFETFKNVFSDMFDFIVGICEMIGGIIEALCGLLTGDTEMMVNGITLLWEGFITGISGLLNWAVDIIVGIFKVLEQMVLIVIQGFVSIVIGLFQYLANAAINAFTWLWDTIVSAATDACTSVYDTVVSGFTSMMDWLTALPEKALEWGADFINGFVDGILNALPSLQNAVSDIANSIREKLHFSVPDTGPLTDYESWMPDMIHGLSGTLKNSASELYGAVNDIAVGVKDGFNFDVNGLVNASVASPSTAMSTVSSIVTNVTQNVNINNSFHGESREMQSNMAKAMNGSAEDATALMARAFAYAR